MVLLTLAGFSFLYIPLSISCCCVFFSVPFATLGPGAIDEYASAFCQNFTSTLALGSEALSSPEGGSADDDPKPRCSSSRTIGSVVITSAANCQRSIARGIESRISFAKRNGEAVSVPVAVNGKEFEFFAVKDDDWEYWATLFCQHHGIPDVRGCAQGIVSEASGLFEEESRRSSERQRAALEMNASDGGSLAYMNQTLATFQPAVKIKLYHFKDTKVSQDSSSNMHPADGGVDGYGGSMSREWSMITRGIESHSYLDFADDCRSSDIVFCMVPPGPMSPHWWCPPLAGTLEGCNRKAIAILDLTDRAGLPHAMSTYLEEIDDDANEFSVHYFKRSFVMRASGVSTHLPDPTSSAHHHSLQLSLLPSYLIPGGLKSLNAENFGQRHFYVTCSLRPSSTSRIWVLETLTALTEALPADRIFLGQVNDSTRRSLSSGYLKLLSESQIIVTSNPPAWEGDHRLWEALASGALVVVDRSSGWDSGFGLVDGINCVMYDMWDEGSLRRVLDRFLKRGEAGRLEAWEIGRRGFEWATREGSMARRVEQIVLESGIVE